MTIIHLAARPTTITRPLCASPLADWLWKRLRATFPHALAACLMPDHIHVVAEVHDPSTVRRRVARLLSGLTRSRLGEDHGLSWAPQPPPLVITGRQKVRRQVRYVSLNAARAGLVADPLEWPWCTHRDTVGATADPWVDADFLASALGERRPGFPARHHAYVTGDPSVAVDGTAFPQAMTPHPDMPPGLMMLARASATATRSNLRDVEQKGETQRLFVRLAQALRPDAAHAAATIAKVHVRTIRRAPDPSPAALRAALLCLGDSRLLRTSHVPPGSGPQRSSGISIPDWDSVA